MTLQPTYLVLGYGIPEDIIVDRNYNTYLSTVFNTLYREVLSFRQSCRVIVCGGNTDTVKPYDRTEAGELARWFRNLLSAPYLEAYEPLVEIVEENTSYSTLENLLNAKKLIKESDCVTVFCEYTRRERISRLAKQVLGASYKDSIMIDFDTGIQRYDETIVQEREANMLKYDEWTLSSPNNMQRHHEFYKSRIDFIRAHPKEPDVVKRWWQEKLAAEWKYIEGQV